MWYIQRGNLSVLHADGCIILVFVWYIQRRGIYGMITERCIILVFVWYIQHLDYKYKSVQDVLYLFLCGIYSLTTLNTAHEWRCIILVFDGICSFGGLMGVGYICRKLN